MDYWQRLFSTVYVNPEGHPDVSPSESSAIVSILSAGTFFGALASPLLADNIGRRLSLIVSSFVFILGVILQTVATAATSRHGGSEVLPTKFRLMTTEANNDTYQGAIHVDSCRKDRVLVALVCQD